jgi:hypothetical protein
MTNAPREFWTIWIPRTHVRGFADPTEPNLYPEKYAKFIEATRVAELEQIRIADAHVIDFLRRENDPLRAEVERLKALHYERTKDADVWITEIERLKGALAFIANGCLVPPDGGSPKLEDAVTAAKEALTSEAGK